MSRGGGPAVIPCMVGVTLVLCATASSSEAALPSFLGSGFPLETLDPAPAGGSFVVTPQPLPRDTVGVRLVVDYAWMPLGLRDSSTASLVAYSGGAYAHLGIATEWADWGFLSLDVPAVLSQSVTLDSTAVGFTTIGSQGPQPSIVQDPQAGDLGDIRLGARFDLRRDWLAQGDCLRLGAGLDVWLPTGNAGTLMGDSAVRLRGYALASGERATSGPIPCGMHETEVEAAHFNARRKAVFYSVALGYQGLGTGGDLSTSPGLSVRAGLGVRLPTGSWQLRPSVEYAGAPLTSTCDPARATNEVFLSMLFESKSGWTPGVSVSTAELASAPGSPPFRASLLLQYRGPYQEGPSMSDAR